MNHIIKEEDIFLFTDGQGNIPVNSPRGYGLFYRDTRFLHHFSWELSDIPMISLCSKAAGAESEYRYTNKEVMRGDSLILWRESLELVHRRRIFEGVVYETFHFVNLDQRAVNTRLKLTVGADFTDMFIIRGFSTGKRGEEPDCQVLDSGLRFSYKGLDGRERKTEIVFDSQPSAIRQNGSVEIPLSLHPGEKRDIGFKIIPYLDKKPQVLDQTEAQTRLWTSYRAWMEKMPQLESDHPDFNAMFQTGLHDFRMLLTDVGNGKLPVAGLPWFAVPFGRDSLIASLQSLFIDPELGKATIRTMMQKQGTRLDPWKDEEPGKILHEIRYGELTETNQVPFSPYYGSVDATPLFLILIHEIYRFTGDLSFVRECAESAKKAFAWIDEYGDPDNRGYTSYACKSAKGIRNQGWKDSENSIVHTDGTLAEAPIALVEVQGYVYWAKKAWARLFEQLGESSLARRLERDANHLQKRFLRDFWMPQEEYMALALDKDRRQVGAIASNAGHLLMSGILDEAKAGSVARRLLQPDLFSGWGIRTLSAEHPAYNPMSYHNGSVWPHDNSLILLGLVEWNMTEALSLLLDGLIAASDHFPERRLPELFCGYERSGGSLIPYPVACSPQAWAAGTAFVMLRAMLGLKPDAVQKKIVLTPSLPASINRLNANRLRIGEGELDVSLYKSGDTVYTAVKRNTTGWDVIIG
jgi:glycogen debranching enzyme